jgi:transmembrane sensor
MIEVDRQNEQEINRQAVAWLRRLTSGDATVADAAELRRWRNRSAAHAAAFAAASRLWKDLEPAGRSVRLREEMSEPPQPALVGRRIFIAGGLMAASVAGAYAVARPPLGLWPSYGELTADYRTAAGEQRRVTLSDAVSIRLNTRTSIAIESSDAHADRIELIAGEASFAAARRGGRAFAVRAADRWITGEGAQFDVRYLQASGFVGVTCLSGEVRVERAGEMTIIPGGQRLRYDARTVAPLEIVDTELVSAWQRGLLIFRSTPLSDVVEEVNRYRPGRIVVMSTALGRMPVSGRFRIDHLEEILTRIEQAFGAKLRSLPGGVVLLS